MKWLENAIAAVSPKWAAERAAFLMKLTAMRGYDAAAAGRRNAGWQRPATSANAEIAQAGGVLRNSSRELVRNNPFGKKAKRSYVSNMVGTGIMPRPATGSKARDRKIAAALAAWCEKCDADGMLTFYGLQGLVAGTLIESGEVLTRFQDVMPPARGDLDATDLFKLQLIEPDYLDTSRTGALPNGNIIEHGIEFTAKGRRAAYYLYADHPGAAAAGLRSRSLRSIRVPADQIAHVMRVDRPGQSRGVPEFAASLQRFNDLAEFEEAELMRKKIAACFVAFITQADGGASPLAGAAATTDAAQRRIESLAPGLLQYLKLGESVEFGSPPPSENYKEFTAAQLHAIAAGIPMTYGEMTGDFSQYNYSSFKADNNGYRRAIEMDQWLILIPMFCDPAYRRFIDRLAIAGVIDRPHYGVEWETPRFESIEPVKDSIADRNDVRSGFIDLKTAIQRRGYNPDTVLANIAETAKQLDELGLTLDTDPRRVAGSGQAQSDGSNKPGTAEGETGSKEGGEQ